MDAQERSELVEIIREVMRAEVPALIRAEVPALVRAEIQAALEPYATRVEVQTMIDTAFDNLAASTLREFESLRQQIQSLDARVAKIENLMGRRLDNLDSTVSEQRSLVYTMRQEHAVLRERLAELEERIAKLEGSHNG